MHKRVNMTKPITKSINLHSLDQTGAATSILHRSLDSQLLELDYQTTSNTDVFALLDQHGHYCIDTSQHPPALVLFANKIDACLAKNVINSVQQHHYDVYHCRLNTHPRITHYTVGHALFTLLNSLETKQLTHCIVCVGYMAQQFNGKQHFVTQHHDALPDACFISTNNQVLLRGFPLQDYFSALFATYDGDDDIIKTMIAKLTTINLLTDEHVLKQRVNTLRTFLTNKVATFDPSLPSAPQVIL